MKGVTIEKTDNVKEQNKIESLMRTFKIRKGYFSFIFISLAEKREM